MNRLARWPIGAKCPGGADYGHGESRTAVHSGCHVEVLGVDLLRREDRFIAELKTGQYVVELVSRVPAEIWRGCFRWGPCIGTEVFALTADQAARLLDERLRRGATSLLEALKEDAR